MLKVCHEETNYDNLKDILHEFSVKSYRLWIATLPTRNEIASMIRSNDGSLLKPLYKPLASTIISAMAFSGT